MGTGAWTSRQCALTDNPVRGNRPQASQRTRSSPWTRKLRGLFHISHGSAKAQLIWYLKMVAKMWPMDRKSFRPILNILGHFKVPN